jgi:AraC-like DNA-binding protein
MDATASQVMCVPLCKRGRGAALRATRLQRICTYVETNLADPSLSAKAASRALGISVRSLHLALAPTGETFGDLVQRRRLAACHSLLRRPDNPATIAEIAFASGFNSLSSFYRAFRRAYGACPSEAARPAMRGFLPNTDGLTNGHLSIA